MVFPDLISLSTMLGLKVIRPDSVWSLSPESEPPNVLTMTRSTLGRPDQMLSRFDTNNKKVSVNMSPPSSSASNQIQVSLDVT